MGKRRARVNDVMNIMIIPVEKGAIINVVCPSGDIFSTTEIPYGSRYHRKIEEWKLAAHGLEKFGQKIKIIDLRTKSVTKKHMREDDEQKLT